MPDLFADLATPAPIADGRAWSAELDSWDQYRDDVYFRVTLWRDGAVISRFMVRVDEYLGAWDGQRRLPDPAAALAHYRVQLSAVAAFGASNCAWGTPEFPGQDG
ncbi:MAG: hypothetical protein ABIO70_30530 [Pseudomonadota bacterium]